MADDKFFKRALDSMRDMVLIKGPESRLLWANRAFLKYYGMSEEELKGIIDGPQSNPDDTLQYVRDDKFVFDTEKDLNIPSEPVTNSKGEVNYFHTIKSPIFENGKMTQSVGVTRLIEDEGILEQDIKELDAKIFTAPLRSIIDTLPIGAMLLDHDLRIVKCNERWCDLFGNGPVSSNENLSDFFETLIELVPIAKKVLTFEKEIEKVIQIEKNDEIKFFDFRLSPWKYPNGMVGGVMAVVTDITAIKLNERKVENSNIKLSHLNEELSQFAYRTSHDLKAPLATIKGLTYFIEEDLEDGDVVEVKKNIKQVFRQAEKLEKLVVDILDLAKSDLAEQEHANVDVEKLLNEIQESYSDLISEKNVDIIFNVQSNTLVWSQETRLRQILSNLISNSIKYSDNKKAKKFVKVSCIIDDWVTFFVEDNGVGIQAANKDRVFDIFSRFDVQLADGSGLGMSIVKKSVEALGGNITFQSSESGTQFKVTFPNIKTD